VSKPQVRAEPSKASKAPKVEVVLAQSKVVENISNNPAGNIARMPGKCDQKLRVKWIRVMPVTSTCADEPTTNLLEPSVQLAAIPGGIFSHD
jgi:hypothetical protein